MTVIQINDRKQPESYLHDWIQHICATNSDGGWVNASLIVINEVPCRLFNLGFVKPLTGVGLKFRVELEEEKYDWGNDLILFIHWLTYLLEPTA